MSISKSIDVQCDICSRWIVEGAATLEEAKESARSIGASVRQGSDICYSCLPDDEQLRNIEREIGLRR